MARRFNGFRRNMDIEDRPFWIKAGLWCVLTGLAGLLLLLLFRLMPQIDQTVSNWFFTQTACANPVEGVRCGAFALDSDPFWRMMRAIGFHLPRVLMVGVLVYFSWLLIYKADKSDNDLRRPLVAILSALLGPLLITNLILKEYWGRPRPLKTEFFGGEFPYIAPGDISTYCQSNCSFVSGEASAAFWMLAAVLLCSAGRRPIIFGVTLLIAVAIALLRVGFGRHYISDVVIAAFISLTCILFSIWLVQTAPVSRWITSLRQYSNQHVRGANPSKN